MNETWVSVTEAASMLQRSRKTIYLYIKQGWLTARKNTPVSNSHLRIDRESVVRLLCGDK